MHEDDAGPRAGRTGRPALWTLLVTVATLVLGLAPPASANIADGFHQVLNRQSRECLTVVGGAGQAGAEVRVDDCTDGMHQRWQPLPASSSPWREIGLKQLQVQHSGLCLTVQGTGFGANVVQDSCRPDDPSQLFLVSHVSSGYSRLQLFFAGGMCLDKAGGDVTLWSCWDPWWQQWTSLG